jgi:hypothetical protein
MEQQDEADHQLKNLSTPFAYLYDFGTAGNTTSPSLAPARARCSCGRCRKRARTGAYSAKPVSIEEDVPPLAALHDLLRKVGLLQLRNGALTPTKAATDDLHVIRRLRSWSEPGDFDGILAQVSVGFLAARGPRQVDDLATAAHPYLGHRWAMSGRPMTVPDVKNALYGLRTTLEGLDLIETHD